MSSCGRLRCGWDVCQKILQANFLGEDAIQVGVRVVRSLQAELLRESALHLEHQAST